jgi:hypothetical protein
MFCPNLATKRYVSGVITGLYEQEAQEIVTTIAGQAGSQELRASFLALPEVQAVSAG